MDQPLAVASFEHDPTLPQRRPRPVATLIILAMVFLVFVLEILAGGSTNPDVLQDLGAAYGPYIRGGEYWRLVMPMFLHAGVLHLSLNSYVLYILGGLLERVYGYGRFACLYVGAGIGGSLLSIWHSNDVVAVGASGAILGIAGAMVVTGLAHPGAVPPRWRRLFGTRILPFVILELILGALIPRIDNWAHLGGVVSGMLLAFAIPPPPPPEYDYISETVSRPSEAMVVLPIAIVVLSMVATARHYRVSLAAEHLLEQGARFHTLHQDDKAAAAWREAARLTPADERPHEQLGLLYLDEKRIPDAIHEYREALHFSPGSPRAQLGLARAYRESGDLAKSRELFEAVLSKNPPDAQGQEDLANLCAEVKLYQEAVSHYRQALRLDPKMAEAYNNLAWLYATSEDPHFRNPEQALELARHAVELTQWNQATYIDTLAEAFYANRNYAEAVRVQTKALQLEPEKPEYQDHMDRYRKAAGG